MTFLGILTRIPWLLWSHAAGERVKNNPYFFTCVQ
jgi:hypothetical protein